MTAVDGLLSELVGFETIAGILRRLGKSHAARG